MRLGRGWSDQCSHCIGQMMSPIGWKCQLMTSSSPPITPSSAGFIYSNTVSIRITNKIGRTIPSRPRVEQQGVVHANVRKFKYWSVT
eukprot:13236778-Ditylum_brightwellii.AAC.1